MDNEIVMVYAPLRWEGYLFADCLPPGRIAAGENYWDLLRHWKSDLEFGQSDVEPAMVYFLQQRLEHASQREKEKEWYCLLFWETHELTFPPRFRGVGHEKFEAYRRSGRLPKLVDAVARRLAGFSPHGKWMTSAPGDGELVKALRLESRMSGECPLIPEDPQKVRQMLVLLSRCMGTAGRDLQEVLSGEDDDILPRLFALLYLRFYRKGLDPACAVESRESYAAKCRGLLLETFRKSACYYGRVVK